ncbi:MAG TPA: ribonuclease Z, partial [Haliea salexigens]|nr:ribonuclease Z [Haliea salexigens]
MKKISLLAGVIVVAAVTAYGQRANLAARVLENGLEARLGADRIAELEDGLHLALCGACGPLPAPNASGP